MFGGHPGPWDAKPSWNGWWGVNPPFHHPVFVLTRHAREPLELEGGTTFRFVTEGIEAALRPGEPPAVRMCRSAMRRQTAKRALEPRVAAQNENVNETRRAPRSATGGGRIWSRSTGIHRAGQIAPAVIVPTAAPTPL